MKLALAIEMILSRKDYWSIMDLGQCPERSDAAGAVDFGRCGHPQKHIGGDVRRKKLPDVQSRRSRVSNSHVRAGYRCARQSEVRGVLIHKNLGRIQSDSPSLDRTSVG